MELLVATNILYNYYHSLLFITTLLSCFLNNLFILYNFNFFLKNNINIDYLYLKMYYISKFHLKY